MYRHPCSLWVSFGAFWLQLLVICLLTPGPHARNSPLDCIILSKEIGSLNVNLLDSNKGATDFLCCMERVKCSLAVLFPPLKLPLLWWTLPGHEVSVAMACVLVSVMVPCSALTTSVQMAFCKCPWQLPLSSKERTRPGQHWQCLF